MSPAQPTFRGGWVGSTAFANLERQRTALELIACLLLKAARFRCGRGRVASGVGQGRVAVATDPFAEMRLGFKTCGHRSG